MFDTTDTAGVGVPVVGLDYHTDEQLKNRVIQLSNELRQAVASGAHERLERDRFAMDLEELRHEHAHLESVNDKQFDELSSLRGRLEQVQQRADELERELNELRGSQC